MNVNLNYLYALKDMTKPPATSVPLTGISHAKRGRVRLVDVGITIYSCGTSTRYRGFRPHSFNVSCPTQNRMKHVIISIVVFISYWAVQPSAHADSENVTIGLLLCSTGDCADWGTAASRGAQLAAEKINKEGGLLGYELRFIAEDTKEAIGGTNAVTAYRTLKDVRNIKLIIGPSWSPGALAVLPIASKDSNVVLMTPSANAKKFSEGANNLFNIRPIYDPSTRALAQLAHDRGWKNLAIFGSQSEAEVIQSDVFADTTKELGGKIVARVEPLPDQTDLRAEALKIVRAKPDAIFVMNYSQMPVALSELAKLGYRGSKLAIAVDSHRIQAAHGAFENLIIADSPQPEDWFKKAFFDKYGEPPGLSAENGYDAMLAYGEAIKLAKSTEPVKVKSALQNVRIAGASGSVSFSASRAVEMPPVLYQVRDGNLVKLGS